MQSFPYVDLARWPIIQYAVVVVIIGTWVVGVMRGLRSKPSMGGHDSNSNGNIRWEPRWFFDGPVKAAIDHLSGMYRLMQDIRSDQREAVQEFRDKYDREITQLNEIKHAVERLTEAVDRLHNVLDSRRGR